MFYYINGNLTHLASGFAVLDVGGVGYKLTISGTTYNAMPPRSASNPPTVRLYTYLAVRAALSVLSLLTPEKFALAVCTDDRKTISKANGIGPKTAARIILELKDKMLKESGGELPSGSGVLPIPDSPGGGRGKLGEAIEALLVLGYSRAEATAVLKDLDIAGMELEEIIRASLKKLMKI